MASFSPPFTTCRIRPPPPVSLLVFVLGVSVIVSAPAFMRFVLLIICPPPASLFCSKKCKVGERPTFCELYLGERLSVEIRICIFCLIFRLNLVAGLNWKVAQRRAALCDWCENTSELVISMLKKLTFSSLQRNFSQHSWKLGCFFNFLQAWTSCTAFFLREPF